MLFIIRLIVGVPVVASLAILIVVIRDYCGEASGFQSEHIKYNQVRVEEYGISRPYRRIRIQAEGQTYYIYPYNNFLPDGMTLDDCAFLLGKSSEATIWIRRDRKNNQLSGINTNHVSIAPSQGAKSNRASRIFLLRFSITGLIVGACIYVYFKRKYHLDWRLDFDHSNWEAK